MNFPKNRHDGALQTRLESIATLEERINELRIYPREKRRSLQEKFLSGFIKLPELFSELSDLADAVLCATYRLAQEEMVRSFGEAKIENDDRQSSEFSVVGMGKLGGRELHFTSDLDLIFIFSRHGESSGSRRLSNQEYFAKLAQRMISYLTLPTAYGYAYKIDTELRPSGQAGALVSSLAAWISYYEEHAALWERQALLKARLVFATGSFTEAFQGLFSRLIFFRPLSPSISEEIHHLRRRIELELAKETARRWHYKKGRGGLIEIEFIVQFLQLNFGNQYPDILQPNTLLALEQLVRFDLLSYQDKNALERGYLFYRWMEILLEIEFDFKEGYLDLEHPCVNLLEEKIPPEESRPLAAAFAEYREGIRKIYCKILKVKDA